ncbi:MAG: hypothetical protein IT363_02190 [Methanoregulaceae archaeon]|nr:hypothetical protein [Methanoregulaceae archaeon]
MIGSDAREVNGTPPLLALASELRSWVDAQSDTKHRRGPLRRVAESGEDPYRRGRAIDPDLVGEDKVCSWPSPGQEFRFAEDGIKFRPA